MRIHENRKLHGLFGALLASAALLLLAAPANAAPIWKITADFNPTAAPGSEANFYVELTNSGDKPAPETAAGNEENCAPGAPGAVAANCSTITATFPAGITPLGVEGLGLEGVGPSCAEDATTIVCSLPNHEPSSLLWPIGPRGGAKIAPLFTFRAKLSPGASKGETLTSSFEVAGAGAGTAATVAPVTVDPSFPEFGIAAFDSQSAANPQGDPFTQAAGHPYDLTTQLRFNSYNTFDFWKGDVWQVEPNRDIVVDVPLGLVGNPSGMDSCTVSDLANGSGLEAKSLCPPGSQIGTVTLHNAAGNSAIFNENHNLGPLPVFNMEPPSGSAARFGFNAVGTLVFLDAKLRRGPGGHYGISVVARNIPEGLPVHGTELTLWGVPADESHRGQRACPGVLTPWAAGPTCPVTSRPTAFLREPTACTNTGEGVQWTAKAASWFDPGAFDMYDEPDLSDPAWDEESITTHKAPGFPYPPDEWGEKQGPTGCNLVPVRGTLEAQPTSIDTETSTGLEVQVEIPNPGLENPEGTAVSDVKNVKVSLPQGVTINPSQAEGLGVCSPSQYESTEMSFHPTPGKGCPDDSKIGTVSVETPLLEETLPGNVYVAKPYENPFNSLLALYIVIEEPQRGILVKLPGELRTNEKTGRIEAEFGNLPQVPFSSFDFKFREGARAPLVTPPTCGTYETVTEITGWSDPGNPITSKSSFEIVRGIGGGPCPPGGVPGFKPRFSAGSINNNAGDYSPFNMRITRNDGEQDMTRFSATLPPGVLGKLAGVSKCPNAAIAIAKSKQGREEIANPSCPANSEIGRSLVGAGVGSVLTYVPGKVYLGGPFNGRPLSVIAITPVVAGPFDVGTVAVHEALTLNPKTAEVEVDGSASDPIPHMLKGIPAKLRDLRVYVDRDKFIINPTSCDPSATSAELFGGGGNAFTTVDDVPVLLSDRFQASNCAALGFKPKLGLKLKGGTTRGDFPSLKATYRPRKGDANLEGLTVRLPGSAFLEQAHIRTICTRVQFAADKCPKAAQYGYIKATTPLLEEPLQGPVWLRSSNHKLPDLVFDLHGLVDVEVATRIDSVRGGIRATVNSVPDAPLTKVVLTMQGGKKGLIVNSRNLCRGTNKANVESDGHNGKARDFNPVMKPDCGKKRKGK